MMRDENQGHSRLIENGETAFLGAYKHLYMRVCPSVHRSVGPSVTPFQNEVLVRTYCALRMLHQSIS